MKKIFLIFFTLILHEIYCTTLTAGHNQDNNNHVSFAELTELLIMPSDEEIKEIRNIDMIIALESDLREKYDLLSNLIKSKNQHAFTVEEYSKAISHKAKLFSKALIIYQQFATLEQENTQNQNESSK